MSDDKNLTARVRTFVDEMINHSSLDMRATVTDDENGNILVVFQGFDLGLLLGHNAELLDAMQYIARRVFADEVAEGAQIDFDAGGYRDSRHRELEMIALKAAERVKASSVPFVLDPMNAQDRRIVHNVIMDFEGVKTESEGDGQMRRVKLLPE